MDKQKALLKILSPYAPRQLDVSSRGSGLNAVWALQLDGKPVILKTYSSRRGPVQGFLSNLEHAVTGRTPYTARARCRTERANLQLWRDAGFEVPAIIPCDLGPSMPVDSLCMEFLQGPGLLSTLTDTHASTTDKHALFLAFLEPWARRHAEADRRHEPRLIQEHATLGHVLVVESRFVTLDLEVSFTRKARILDLIAGEICGYMRSLLKAVDEPTGAEFVGLLVGHYPHATYLSHAISLFLDAPNPLLRIGHLLNRRRMRKQRAIDKYDVAEQLRAAQERTTRP